MGKAANRKKERQQQLENDWQPLEKKRAEVQDIDLDKMDVLEKAGYTAEQLDAILRQAAVIDVYMNHLYWVAYRHAGEGLVHLRIRRHDRREIRNFDHLQRIKNELVGAECEAVELYPAESRKLSDGPYYHLWVSKDPSYRWPFGFGH